MEKLKSGKIDSVEVIQSYIITSARYKFTAYEKRVLYRIIEILQSELNGVPLNEGYKIDKNLFDDRKFTIPVSAFLNGENDKNHSLVKKALMDLRDKAFEYEDASTWRYLGIIERPIIDKYSEFAHFTVTPMLYEAFLNFAKGFKKYELTTAFKFESVYAMRFYEMFYSQKSPISYSVQSLKEMFMLTDKYVGRPSDFVKNVVDVAKKELDKHSPYSFDYRTNIDMGEGRKIEIIKFYPTITDNTDPALEKEKLKTKTSPHWELERRVIDYLKQALDFQDNDIKNNINLLVKAYEKFDLLGFLSEKKSVIMSKNAPVGYAISCMKNELAKFN
jgi:plasmid replication initiation protein